MSNKSVGIIGQSKLLAGYRRVIQYK